MARPLIRSAGPVEPTMHIGEAAARAGVNIRTLHYYENRGLLPRPARTESNYRLYSADAVRRVRFVKRAQELGFTLAEIKELLGLRVDSTAACSDVRRLAEEKIIDIDGKLRALRSMKRALERMVVACTDGEASASDCPILEALDRDRPGGAARAQRGRRYGTTKSHGEAPR